MNVYVNITKHKKVFYNAEGQEVYPPGHPNSGMVKPAGERERDPGLPPKSLAEENMEIANRQKALIDPEAQAAIDLLKSKGIL